MEWNGIECIEGCSATVRFTKKNKITMGEEKHR